jgi:hypothetical protein
MTLEEELVRAGKAEQILAEPLFKECVTTIREALIDGIRRSAFTEDKLREKLCQRLALLEELVGQLQTVMETGKLAEETIRQKTIAERIRAATGF